MFLKPEITFLESKVSERGILVQQMIEETDEPVDTLIKFSKGTKTSAAGKYYSANIFGFSFLNVRCEDVQGNA